MPTIDRRSVRAKIRRRIRKKISGTAERPRLAVSFSGKHVYAQVIDDTSGRTIASANTTEKALCPKGGPRSNCDTAKAIGEEIAKRAKDAKVDSVVFDRGGFAYHGKVKFLADAARDGGLKF